MYSEMNVGIVDVLSQGGITEEFMAGRIKICRAELGLPENYKDLKAHHIPRLAERGFDNPVKRGVLMALHAGGAAEGKTQYPCAVASRARTP